MRNKCSDHWVPDIFEADDHRVEPDHVLETGRLVLRPVTREHLDEYARLLADPDVMKYVGIEAGQVLDHAQAEELVIGAAEAWPKRGFGRWTIFEQGSERFVGFVGFRSEEGAPELICLLRKDLWGQGYATESSSACLNYGFASLGFREVCSYCRPNNEKARRLLERLGGEFVGLTDFHGVEGAAYRFVPTNL